MTFQKSIGTVSAVLKVRWGTRIIYAQYTEWCQVFMCRGGSKIQEVRGTKYSQWTKHAIVVTYILLLMSTLYLFLFSGPNPSHRKPIKFDPGSWFIRRRRRIGRHESSRLHLPVLRCFLYLAVSS